MSGMSTNRAITAQPHEHTLTETDLATIAELVMWHLMPTLSIRRLIQLNCPTWNMWDPVMVHRVAQARTNDDTRDWYFPVVVKKVERWSRGSCKYNDWNGNKIRFRGVVQPNVPELSWSWSGVFHPDATANSVSAMALSLPPLTHLPHEWNQLSLPVDDIIASAGGLLLIKSVHGGVPARRSSRLNQQLTLPLNASITQRRYHWMWTRLLVCNPVTRECRELPDASPAQHGKMVAWHNVYHYGVQATMVVDDKHNCYQVILTFQAFVAVYQSTTNNWRCVYFRAPRAWGGVDQDVRFSREWTSLTCWSYHCATVHTSAGRFLFADVRPIGVDHAGIRTAVNAILVGEVRLFEVDTEAGQWKLVYAYELRKFHAPFLNYRPHPRLYDMSILTFIELVECMEGIYVVYPAKLYDILVIGGEQSYDEVYDPEAIDKHMPLAFYIMGLQGEGTNKGVLRIQVPRTRLDFQARSAKLHLMACHQQPFYCKFFSCYACGSTIWVSILDYVLTYNVASQESTTKIITLNPNEVEPLRFAYRPNLHMRP